MMTTNENNAGEDIDHSSLATERQNAIIVIESLYRWIDLRYNACPVFCISHIQDAFDSAFGSRMAKERRPLLLYIHHNQSPSIDRFCLEMFCSEMFIDYLRENYIVWPWDITNESNRNILIQIWQEKFPDESVLHFSKYQCPMLIGIRRQFRLENDSSFAPSYRSQVLLIGDGLMRTSRQLNLMTLSDQLVAFKEEFDENEKNLTSNFKVETGLNKDVMLEIAEYLPLNDAVATFSIAILPYLWRYNIRLPVVEPSEEFLRTMMEQNKYRQMISLRAKADHFQEIMKLASSITFTNITSLTLNNLENIKLINQVRTYFPNLICLSLRYDNEIDCRKVGKIIQHILIPIKRFEIHCDSITCSHTDSKRLFQKNLNPTIESFVLNINHSSLRNHCITRDDKCVLRTIIDFIIIMSPNIQYIRVIINQDNGETLLVKNEWMGLLDMCAQLKKITFKVMRRMSHDKEFAEKIEDIVNSMHGKSEFIKFDVLFK